MAVRGSEAGVKVLAFAGVIGALVFGILVVAIPFVKEGYSPVAEPISNGARGSYGYLQTIAFGGLGLGSLALSWGLLRALTGKAGRIGSVLIGLWGLGLVMAAIFPTDLTKEPSTTTGVIHIVVSLLGFVAVLIGILTLSVAFRKNGAWRAFWLTSLALGIAALVAFFVTGPARDTSWWGVSQRVFAGLVLLWLVITGVLLGAGRRTEMP